MTDPMSPQPRPEDEPTGGASAAPPPPGGYQQAPPPQGGHQQPPSPQGGYQETPPPPYQQPPSQGGYQQPRPPSQGGYRQGTPPQDGYYQQPGHPSTQAGSMVGRPAELLDRFLARLIDHVILLVVNFVLVSFVVVGSLMGGSGGMFGGGGNFLTGAVGSVLATAIYLGYFAYLESSRGQTIGKMVVKLETRGAGGGRPTIEEAVRRNIWVALTLLGILPFVGGFLAGLAQLAAMIAIAVGISSDTAGRRGWHDRFAGGTQVVKVG
ncbi:RDD family protein [Ornithinimicrobium sp. W1679]|uniref:RDD family protein n=1 Tax=Ornithinimicrobium sp. W1679 TaxID=3418770 RepID=UPI003CE953A5